MPTACIRDINARPVNVPFAIKPQSASGALSSAALVLIDLMTTEDVIGRSYVFAIHPGMLKPLTEIIDVLSELITGDAIAPLDIEKKLRGSLTLLDTPGLVGIAVAGLDMACWDAHAKLLGQPLAAILGTRQNSVNAYNSCGLWIQDITQLPAEAERLIDARGFNAVKLRLGRPDAALDVEAVDLVQECLGTEVQLMVDFNQSQSVNSARNRIAMIDGRGLCWIEEPIRHGNFRACADLTAGSITPIQIGENIQSSIELGEAITISAANYYMPDVQRIGGVTGWLRASALCHAAEIEMSSHLFPEFSAHLLAASPTAHWLEYVDWANPVLSEPLVIAEGKAIPGDKPGVGIDWDENAVKRYSV